MFNQKLADKNFAHISSKQEIYYSNTGNSIT